MGLTFLLLAIGIVLCTYLVLDSGSGPQETLRILIQFAVYLIPQSMQLLLSPSIAFLVVVYVAMYAGSLVFFAQTATEKKLLWAVFPAAFLALVLNTLAVMAFVMTGLASQGAGQ